VTLRVAHRSIALLGAAALLAIGAACAPDDEATTGPDTCRSLVERAASTADIADTVKLLEDAMLECGTIGRLDRELERFPSIVAAETIDFVSRRCTVSNDVTIASSDICAETAEAPDSPTAASTTTIPAYVGRTLDGRDITIRPGPDTPFVGDTPQPVIQIVDVAAEDGCEAVEELRDWWTAQSEGSGGDAASVYAQHANNVLDFLGC
jgi:hypothetical protein